MTYLPRALPLLLCLSCLAGACASASNAPQAETDARAADDRLRAPAPVDDGWSVQARLHPTRSSRPSPTLLIEAMRAEEQPQACLALELERAEAGGARFPRVAVPPGWRILSATLGECARDYTPPLGDGLAGSIELDVARCRVVVALDDVRLDRRELPLQGCETAGDPG